MSSRSEAAASGCASRAEHALNPRVHFFFFDEFAARNLVYANLHLLLKPFVIGKQLCNGFLQKLIRSPAGLGGEGGELGFLLLRQMHFHIPRVGRAAASVNGLPAMVAWVRLPLSRAAKVRLFEVYPAIGFRYLHYSPIEQSKSKSRY